MQEVMLVFPAGELITVEQVIRDLTMKGQKLLGMSRVLINLKAKRACWEQGQPLEEYHQVFIFSPFFFLFFFYRIVSLFYLFIIVFLGGEGKKLWASHILTGSLTPFWLLVQLHLHGNKLRGLCFPTNSSSQSLVILDFWLSFTTNRASSWEEYRNLKLQINLDGNWLIPETNQK